MDCSPPVVGPNVRLAAVPGVAWCFVLDGAAQQSRCELVLFPKDPFVGEMMELVRQALPGSAAVDFLVDYGESALSMPSLSEWDRFASLICSLVGVPMEEGDKDVSAVVASCPPPERCEASAETVAWRAFHSRRGETRVVVPPGLCWRCSESA